MRSLFSIPNLLTCLNLFCGMCGILAVFNRNIELALLFVSISLVADFLDGFVARLLKISSPIGKELDSLADVLTFGVLPAFVLMFLLAEIYHYESTLELPYPAYIALLIGPFSALRLAKFNLDTRQTDCFLGLATPANTIFIFSLWVIKHYEPHSWVSDLFTHPIALYLYVPFLSFLLISELRLMAFKFKNTSWKDNKWRYILLIICILSLIFFRLTAIPFLIPLYILLSILENTFQEKGSKE